MLYYRYHIHVYHYWQLFSIINIFFYTHIIHNVKTLTDWNPYPLCNHQLKIQSKKVRKMVDIMVYVILFIIYTTLTLYWIKNIQIWNRVLTHGRRHTVLQKNVYSDPQYTIYNIWHTWSTCNLTYYSRLIHSTHSY